MKFFIFFLLTFAAMTATAQNIDTTATGALRCTGKTKTGKACSRPAGTGKNVCWQHDPAHPHNVKK